MWGQQRERNMKKKEGNREGPHQGYSQNKYILPQNKINNNIEGTECQLVLCSKHEGTTLYAKNVPARITLIFGIRIANIPQSILEFFNKQSSHTNQFNVQINTNFHSIYLYWYQIKYQSCPIVIYIYIYAGAEPLPMHSVNLISNKQKSLL